MNLKMATTIEEYFKYSKLNLKETTYKEQERKIMKYIYPFFKDKNIYEIKLKDIIEWKKYIESFNFKYNYKSYLYYSLNRIFDYYCKYYDLEKNYSRIEGNFKNTDSQINGNFWSINELNDFLSVINDKKDYIMFKLLYFTGLRKGELLALTWNDIDLINNKISINKAKTKYGNIQSVKTFSSNRNIYIPNSLINDLKKIKDNSEFIFDISFTTLKRKKDNYCKLSGVKQIKIHEFRHSHAIYLYQNNVPIDEISNRLGHSNISTTTDIYLKYLPKNEKRVIKLLNSVC